MTVVQTVGVGARDHANLAEIEAYLSGIGSIAEDYRFDFYDDGEIVEPGVVTFGDYGQTATNTITLQPAGMNADGTGVSTEGFDAKKNWDTDPLDYDAAKGVGIRTTVNHWTLTLAGFMHLQGLQFLMNLTGNGKITFAGDDIIFRRNILRSQTSHASALPLNLNASVSTGGIVENCAIIGTNPSYASTQGLLRRGNSLAASFYRNCTILLSGSGVDHRVVTIGTDGDNKEVSQCLMLRAVGEGTTELFQSGSALSGGDYNLINSTVHSNLPGLNSLTSGVLADELENGVSSAADDPVDLRLKAGATSIGFIPDASRDANTPTVDIRGQTRVGVDVDCGCFQTAGAVEPPAGGGLMLGSAAVADVKLGSAQVDKIMLGTQLIWPSAPASDKTLDFDFKQNWGAALASAVLQGPALTFSRTGEANGWDEDGVMRTAADGEHRFEHDPGNGNAPIGLRLDDAASNILPSSEDFNNATWGIANSVEVSDAPDPYGTTGRAFTLNDPGSQGSNLQDSDMFISQGQDVCFSVFIKKQTGKANYCGFYVRTQGGSAQNRRVCVDHNNAQVASSALVVETGVIDYGPDWFRVWAHIVDNQSNDELQVRLYPAYNTDGSDGVSSSATGDATFFGPMVELDRTRPSSYVPSPGGASATRNAELCSASDMSWLNDTGEGTFYSRSQAPFNVRAVQSVLRVGDGTVNHGFVQEWINETRLDWIVANGTPVVNFQHVGLAGDTRVASTYLPNPTIPLHHASSADGAASFTSTVGTPATGMTELFVGGETTRMLDGTVAEIRYFNRHFSDAEVEALSADGTEP